MRFLLLLFVKMAFIWNLHSQCVEKCYGKIQYNQTKDILSAKIDYQSNFNVSMYQTPLAFDVDNDGVTEIITSERDLNILNKSVSKKILVIDPINQNIESSITTPYFYCGVSLPIVIANVTSNCEPNYFLALADIDENPDSLRRRIVCLNKNGKILWVSNTKYGVNTTLTYGSSLGLADFNHDGISEIYIFNEIFNAQSGVRLCEGKTNNIGFASYSPLTGIRGFPIAINVDDDSSLELVAGSSVYNINLQNINEEIGNTMTSVNFQIDNITNDGIIAFMDFDRDGILEICLSTSTTASKKGIFIYKIINNTAILIAEFEGSKISTNWYSGHLTTISSNGKNIIYSDIDDKYFGLVNTSFANLDFLHSQIIIDDLAFNGFTLFDFNHDNQLEIIFRDKEFLRIATIEKTDNIVELVKIPCKSFTHSEMPIVAALEKNGEARICVTCMDSNNEGRLTIFGPPPGQRWAPARNIWHQYAYNPLFINDDGTVPQYMHNPATYENGKYNNFMVQESLIDEDGNYPVAAASLTGTAACIDYDIPTQQYTVNFSVHNRSDASASALSGLAVSFYNGNPEAGGTLIGVYRTTADLAAGNTLSGLSYSFAANNLTSLYMIVNTDQYPIMVSDTASYGIDECDYTDNVFILPAPKFSQTQKEICQGDSFDFFGQALTASGTYIHEIAAINACDSVIVALELVVSTTKSVSLTATACDTYTWNGQTYTTDGSYTYDTQSINGCDSITTLNLSVYRSDQLNLTQQSCDDYVWNGQTYNQSGIYTYRTLNIHGCDSIVTLDLTVFPSIDISMSHAACDTFIWNGQSYTESGIYTFQAQTQHGCDSTVTLDLTISDVLHTELPVTACDSYTWNGQTYDAAGDYTFTGISMSGCDSIATLHLSVLSSSFSNESQTACTSFTWNNQTYDQSGTYLFQTKNAQGCDSTATLYLTVHQPTTSEQWVTACDSYYWDNDPFVHNTSGTYTQTIRNKNGCDSLMTLHLLISKSTSDTLDVSACEVYYVNGSIPIFNDVKLVIEGQNSYGCDSNTVYNITIHQPQASTTTENVCDSLNFFGNTLDSTGIYTHTLSDQFGCDSTITLQLNVLSSTLTDRIAMCDSYTWPQTGLTYDTSGIFSQRFTNAVGCDSTYTLDLRILPSYQIEDTIAECGAYLWPIDGSNYDHTGRYSKRFITRDGCDSTYTLVLDIRPQHLFVDTVITNQDYLWDENNTTYTQSGIYTQKFLTSFDCDSVHILDLRINKSTDIFFPNIISPDGINGFFTGYSHNTTITIASLSVYDRWGNLLFHKENFPTNEPLLGWNGKFQGRDVVPGVFTWLAVIRLPDGYTSTLSGDVTVVR